MRKQGLSIVLDLVPPAYPLVLQRLNVERHWVYYHGAIAFDALHHHYALADLGLFASSYENMPNILLETMVSGLPIAYSSIGPMPEILENAGVYFNPKSRLEIANALIIIIKDHAFRTKIARKSFNLAKHHT